MPRSSPKWSGFEKTVTGFLAASTFFLGVVGTLVALLYTNMKSDIDDLKKDTKEISKAVNETRVEMVRAIGAVATQATATNAKLDQLLSDNRRR